MIENRDLKSRIIELSYQHHLSHLGSCLTAVDIVDQIYQLKKVNEPFVLSSGHAGLALYVVLEKYSGLNAEKILDHHGVHPDRCRECKIDVSTGSLGQGLPIAVGMALADRSRNIWCLISDGECAEGSIWEALRIAEEQRLKNLKIWVNINGFGAYDRINTKRLSHKLRDFDLNIIRVRTHVNQLPFLQGLDAHYKVMNEKEYNQAMETLK